MKNIIKELRGEKKHLYILISVLFIFCLLLMASLHRTERAYYQVKSEKEMILDLASQSEVEQLKDDAIWFEKGCEFGADTLMEENKNSANSPDVELSIIAYKSSCSDSAKEVYAQIVKKYKKELAESK